MTYGCKFWLTFPRTSSKIVTKMNKCSKFCMHFTVQKLIINCWVNESTPNITQIERAEKNLNVIKLQKNPIWEKCLWINFHCMLSTFCFLNILLPKVLLLDEYPDKKYFPSILLYPCSKIIFGCLWNSVWFKHVSLSLVVLRPRVPSSSEKYLLGNWGKGNAKTINDTK